MNSWIRSGGNISEYPKKLQSSSTALRSLGQGGPLRRCLPFVLSSSFGSKPRLVKISIKMCTYRRAHIRTMFRCWILHLPLCLLWQPHYTIRAFDLFLYWAWFVSFYVEERARLLPPLRELLFNRLFADYRWHQLSADGWWSADAWSNPGIA